MKTLELHYPMIQFLIMAHSRSFLANQKARNAIVGAENLLMVIGLSGVQFGLKS